MSYQQWELWRLAPMAVVTALRLPASALIPFPQQRRSWWLAVVVSTSFHLRPVAGFGQSSISHPAVAARCVRLRRIDVASFAVSAVLLTFLRGVEHDRSQMRDSVSEAFAGVRFLRSARELARVSGALVVLYSMIGALEPVIFDVVTAGIGRHVEFVSVLLFVQGVGAVLAGLVAGRLVGHVGVTPVISVRRPALRCLDRAVHGTSDMGLGTRQHDVGCGLHGSGSQCDDSPPGQSAIGIAWPSHGCCQHVGDRATDRRYRHRLRIGRDSPFPLGARRDGGTGCHRVLPGAPDKSCSPRRRRDVVPTIVVGDVAEDRRNWPCHVMLTVTAEGSSSGTRLVTVGRPGRSDHGAGAAGPAAAWAARPTRFRTGARGEEAAHPGHRPQTAPDGAARLHVGRGSGVRCSGARPHRRPVRGVCAMSAGPLPPMLATAVPRARSQPPNVPDVIPDTAL